MRSINLLVAMGAAHNVLAIPQELTTSTGNEDGQTVKCQFNGVSQSKTILDDTEDCGFHFDQYLGLEEALPITQLIRYNDGKAASPAYGNEIRSDFGKLESMDPQSVFAGCFFARNLGVTLGAVPTGSSLPFIGDLIAILRTFLVGQVGALSNPAACNITATVIGMADRDGVAGEQRLQGLINQGQQTRTFQFDPEGLNAFGLGFLPTNVKKFPLASEHWKGVTRLTFGVIPKTVNLGDAGTGRIGVALDDYEARKYIRKSC